MTFNGTEFKASIVGTPNKTIADSRDLSIDVGVATIDVSTRDSGGWKETIAGQRSWTASLSGIIDYVQGANETGYQALQDLAVARAPISLKFGRETTGSYAYSGTGIVTSANISAAYEDAVTWTADIEGSGAFVPAVVA